MKLFLPRIVFRVELEPDGCRFIAEVHLRMGPLAQRAHKKELEAVREHMRVEGLNLKRIVEQQAQQAAASTGEAADNASEAANTKFGHLSYGYR